MLHFGSKDMSTQIQRDRSKYGQEAWEESVDDRRTRASTDPLPLYRSGAERRIRCVGEW
jgi:hypothetical protein